MAIIKYILFLIVHRIDLIQSTDDNANKGIHIRVYDNIAEVSRPISPFELPLTYSQEELNGIRSDSFRLIGKYVNIQAQLFSMNRTSLNGNKVLIRRSSENDIYTEAILIDENRNLVHDLVDNTYYFIGSDRMKYLSMPPTSSYTIDFTLYTTHVEQLYLRYLQNNIKWKVHYDLLLDINDSDSKLHAYADLRNDGNAPLLIDSAELIGGDVHIRSSSSTHEQAPMYAFADINAGFAAGAPSPTFTTTPAPTVSPSKELAGVYVYSINQTFVLNPNSNYILPMFRPKINVDRYGFILKYFRAFDNRGYAQRAYRLRIPDTFIPKGQVFVRESDRLVGEIEWLDHAANETNKFTLGEDPDLQYTESIQLISRRDIFDENRYRYILGTYKIKLQLANNKKRAMKIEYHLQFPSQDTLTLKENTNDDLLQVEGPVIIGVFHLKENDKQEIQFTVETQ